MATRYVRSTDGNDADNGTTWALAKATLSGAASGRVSGDIIYVSQSHAESTAGSTSISWTSSTPASPLSIICANDGAAPPTAVATTGSVSTTGASSTIAFDGDTGTPYAYVYGLTFNAGDSANLASININTSGTGNAYKFESCKFKLQNSNASSRINLNSSVIGRITLVNCECRFGSASQFININGRVRIEGGSFTSGTTTPSEVFNHSSTPTDVEVVGMDFSNLSSSVTLVDPGSASVRINYRFIGCTMPASWSGSLVSAAPGNAASVVELINTDASGTNYRYWKETAQGSIKHSTSIYRNNGYSIDSTHIGYTFASTANCKFPLTALQSGWLVPQYNSTVGSSVTATIQFATNNVTLKDDEFVIELFYLSASGAPIYARVSSEKASFLATAANLTTSSETWTGVPGTPVKQKASVTFTPQMAGLVLARVSLFKPSTTVYVDPLVVLT